MCGLTHEDWMIMRGAIEDRHEPHRAAVLSGMTAGHEVDVEVQMREMRWKEAGDVPATRLRDAMEHEVCGYTAAEHLVRPELRRNKWLEVRRYRATQRVWTYSEPGYGGLD